jgi:hypothetical protein
MDVGLAAGLVREYKYKYKYVYVYLYMYIKEGAQPATQPRNQEG